MYRRLVNSIPRPVRRRLLAVLPSVLDSALRSRYYRQSLARRAALRLSAARIRRRHPRLLALPDVRLLSVGRRSWLCREIEHLSVEHARQAHLDLVTALLDRSGIDYFVVRTGSHLRHCVAVAASERVHFLTRIADELRDQPVYVSSRPRRRRRTQHVLAADLAVENLTAAPHIRVGQIFASGCGRLVNGLANACDIEFWEERDDRSLHAPRRNRASSVLRPEHRVAATMVIRERPYRTVEPFATPSLAEVPFPVDVVYTWVDGEDPGWRAKKERHMMLLGKGPLNDQAANSARFLSRDELKYSLRSLSMYADWVRTIYLVTDDQVPTWLDTSNPRLRLVSHREIFDRNDCLPTFNSHAIESRLHHIDGLSEHYLYLNDDVFFGRAVPAELFFHGNGLSKFFMSKAQLDLGPPEAHDQPVMSAAKNNRRLIETAFDRTITQKLKHVPHTQQRSVLFEMERLFPQQFAQTARSRFRSHDDISIASSLHHYFAYSIGRAVPGEIRYAYTDNSDPATPKRLERLRWRRDYDVMCLNDTDLTGVNADHQADRLRTFLEDYFPLPSPFELTASAPAELSAVPQAHASIGSAPPSVVHQLAQ